MNVQILLPNEERQLSNVKSLSREYPDQDGSQDTSILHVEYYSPKMSDAAYHSAIVEEVELTAAEIDGQTTELVE